MISWNYDLAWAAINDKVRLGALLHAHIPEDFPNEPVRKFVLPTKLLELEEDPSVGRWSGLILHTGDSIVIGSMGFKTPPTRDGSVELGYDIIPAYQGRGYATEMARALCDWALSQQNVVRIAAECLKTNAPSIRVLEKIGMKQVSETDDMLQWERTES